MIIMFRGKPGVGKSTIAHTLAERLDAIVIAKDDINDIVFAKFGANRSASELSYDVIAHFVQLLDPTKRKLIIDCSLASRASYQQFADLARGLGSDLRVIHVTLDDPAEIESRLATRSALPEHRVKTPNDINKLQLSYEDYPVENEIRVSGFESTERVVNTILENLS